MEKRATPRHLISTSIVCSFLNSAGFGEPVDGRMKNCCVDGLYAELRFYFKPETILVVRATGSSCGYSREEGFRSLAIWHCLQKAQGLLHHFPLLYSYRVLRKTDAIRWSVRCFKQDRPA